MKRFLTLPCLILYLLVSAINRRCAGNCSGSSQRGNVGYGEREKVNWLSIAFTKARPVILYMLVAATSLQAFPATAQLFTPTTPNNLVNMVNVGIGVGMHAGTLVGVFGNDTNMASAGTKVGGASSFYNMQNANVELIFWGTGWSSQSATKTALINNAQTLISGPYLSQLAQYGVKSVKWSGYIDSGSIPSSCGSNPPAKADALTIRSFMWCLISKGKVPAVFTSSGTTVYMVFVPPNVSLPGFNGGMNALAYHFGVPDSVACGATVYASDATDQLFLIEFALGPLLASIFDITQASCHSSDFASTGIVSFAAANGFVNNVDGLTYAFTHELIEAMTDPIPSVGWAASVSDSAHPVETEIGDICDNDNHISARLQGLLVPPYWSNAQNACVIPIGDLTTLGSGALTSYSDGVNPHVVYLGTDNTIRDAVYNRSNWLLADGYPSTPMALTGLTSFYNSAVGAHVFYVGSDWHIHDLYGVDLMANDADAASYQPPNVQNPLTTVAGGPVGITSFYDGSTKHVFYTGMDSYLHELYSFNGTQWWHNNLGGFSIPVNTELTGFFDGRYEHVFYSDGSQLHEMIYDEQVNGGWADYDITAETGAANIGSGVLASYYDTINGVGHVFYIGTNGHVYDLSSVTSSTYTNFWNMPYDLWNVYDVTVQTSSTAIPTTLAADFNPSLGIGQLYYFDTSNVWHRVFGWSGFGWVQAETKNVAPLPIGTRAFTSLYNPSNSAENNFSVGYGPNVYQFINQSIPVFNSSDGEWWLSDITSIAVDPGCSYGKTPVPGCVTNAVP